MLFLLLLSLFVLELIQTGFVVFSDDQLLELSLALPLARLIQLVSEGHHHLHYHFHVLQTPLVEVTRNQNVLIFSHFEILHYFPQFRVYFPPDCALSFLLGKAVLQLFPSLFAGDVIFEVQQSASHLVQNSHLFVIPLIPELHHLFQQIREMAQNEHLRLHN